MWGGVLQVQRVALLSLTAVATLHHIVQQHPVRPARSARVVDVAMGVDVHFYTAL